MRKLLTNLALIGAMIGVHITEIITSAGAAEYPEPVAITALPFNTEVSRQLQQSKKPKPPR